MIDLICLRYSKSKYAIKLYICLFTHTHTQPVYIYQFFSNGVQMYPDILVVTTQGAVLLVSSGQKPMMLLNILQCLLQQRIIHSKISLDIDQETFLYAYSLCYNHLPSFIEKCKVFISRNAFQLPGRFNQTTIIREEQNSFLTLIQRVHIPCQVFLWSQFQNKLAFVQFNFFT